MNVVEVSGRLTRDSDLKFLGQGFPVLEMNIAVDDGHSRWDRESRKSIVGSGFYQVEVFGSMAEDLVETCLKGAEVYVKGSLSQWTKEGQDGSKDSKTRIRAVTVQVIQKARQQAQTQQPAAGDPWATSGAQQGGGAWRSGPAQEEPPF